MIILCYSIAEPETLSSVHTNWKGLVETHYNYDEAIPVILLGLIRDSREKEDYDGRVRRVTSDGTGEEEMLTDRRVVYPQEGLKVAQEMRCDRYCECSALTGEVSLWTFVISLSPERRCKQTTHVADLPASSSAAKSLKI